MYICSFPWWLLSDLEVFSFSERTAGQSHEHLPEAASQGVISLSGDSWMYPYQRTPIGNPYISPILWAFIGHNPQESLENTINIMGTLLGVHPIVPWHWILVGFFLEILISWFVFKNPLLVEWVGFHENKSPQQPGVFFSFFRIYLPTQDADSSSLPAWHENVSRWQGIPTTKPLIF